MLPSRASWGWGAGGLAEVNPGSILSAGSRERPGHTTAQGAGTHAASTANNNRTTTVTSTPDTTHT